MVETLTNLKNNRVKSDPGSSGPGSLQAAEDTMSSFLTNYAKTHGGKTCNSCKKHILT